MEEYIASLSRKNYVCEVFLGAELVSILFIARNHTSSVKASQEFREQARKMKSQLQASSLNIVMHM